MKRSLLFSCGLIIVLMLLLPPTTMSAAPQFQSGVDETIQIVLVLDVSGSMGTAVYTGIVPEDLLSLLLRMDELKKDPEYIRLVEGAEEAENDPEVMEAKQDSKDTYDMLQDWIIQEHELSLLEIQTNISLLLKEGGCDKSSSEAISTASSYDNIDFYVDWDCPISLDTPDLVENIKDQVPYINDSNYQTLRETWQQALLNYNETLELSGNLSFSQSLEDYKSTGVYKQVQDEIDQLVTLYNIPSRLELAKSAATNLIDLSRLYRDNTGVDSKIGLVTFSSQANFEHGLTLNHTNIKNLITAMEPLNQTNIGDALQMGLSELETNSDPDKPRMVILLSDGHANIGLSSSEILAVIPPRANDQGITLCTAGFADIESEVDFVLLEGLAYQTEGEYLFTNSGAELGSFFAACREAAAGKKLTEQITGIVKVGDIQEVSTFAIDRDTCGFSLVLNYLSGSPIIEAINPEGDSISSSDAGVTYQTRNQVQLYDVELPMLGDWKINLRNEDQAEMDAVVSLVISTSPCTEPREISEDTSAIELPYLLTIAGTPAGTGIVVLVIVLLAGVTAYVILIRQRRP